MNSLLRLVGVLLVVGVSLAPSARSEELPTSTPAAEGLSDEKLQEIRPVMNRLIRDKHFAGGLVLIARHGKIVFHEPYGQMHDAKGRPLQRDTIFRLYSMSKAITSAAALMLVDEGKLDLAAAIAMAGRS